MNRATFGCSSHPDAPHGFDRTASHSAGRYVCTCEGWEPSELPAHVATPRVPERPSRSDMNPLSQYAIDRIVGRLQVGFTYAVELDDMTKIARAIEAAHGIKGEA